jgi:hypothetical protein
MFEFWAGAIFRPIELLEGPIFPVAGIYVNVEYVVAPALVPYPPEPVNSKPYE